MRSSKVLCAWVLVLSAGAVLGACAPALSPSTWHSAAERVPARAERAIDLLLAGFDRAAAMEHVAFMSRYWRLAGLLSHERRHARQSERGRDAECGRRGGSGRARIKRERRETSKDRDAAVAAWTKWYEEAVASVSRLTIQ